MKKQIFLACLYVWITLFVSACASNPLRDANGLTPLHIAAGRGDLARVKALIGQGEDLLAVDSKMGISILSKAVYSGNAETVEYLLSQGALIDLQSPSNGNTPLHDAIYFRGGSGLRVVQTLLRYHPSLAIKNRAGLTPIESAKLLGASDIVATLVQYERSTHTSAAQALMKVVQKNDIKTVRTLIETQHPNLEEANEQGFTPLIWSAREGFVEIARLLLEKGADPNHSDTWMRANAAHKVAFWGRAEMMRLLVLTQIDLNAQGGYNGYTPLHDAIAQNHVEVVRILVQAGVKTDVEGHDGKTALSLAREKNNPEILRLLSK